MIRSPRVAGRASTVRAALGPALALLLAAPGSAQDVLHDPITANEIQEHVDVLASDLFEGREAATRGERRAAAYIISNLEGLERVEPADEDGDWLQPFRLDQSPFFDFRQASRGSDTPEPDATEDDAEGDAVDQDEQRRRRQRGSLRRLLAEAPDARARNVLARIPGSDPELAHQAIIIGAHYDHVGHGEHGNALGGERGEIHNGADDNASGSAVLLELAAALATAERPPRRTILIQWYSGEELGLLGSLHYVANPTHPLEDSIAMVNLDMVGRLLGSTAMVGGTGTAELWPGLVERLGQAHDLVLIQDEPGVAPSDNASFYQAELPVLFVFTGIHDDYHRIGDDAHKLNAEGTARIGRFVHDLIRELDALDEPPAFVPAPGQSYYYTPGVFWGLTLDEAEADAPGRVEVAVLIPDSPCGAAGLAEGDILLAVDGEPVQGVDRLERRLQQIDAERSPRIFRVARPRPDGTHDTLELAAHPVVR